MTILRQDGSFPPDAAPACILPSIDGDCLVGRAVRDLGSMTIGIAGAEIQSPDGDPEPRVTFHIYKLAQETRTELAASKGLTR
jgi:hypothetical protein